MSGERSSALQETSHIDRGQSTSRKGEVVDSDSGQENVFGTTGKATDFFVAKTYRPGQREALEEIENAFEQGYQYVVMEAPTGSGKSHIARALAFQSGRAHILTIQKLLQSQYERDFDDMAIMKGRSAYECYHGDTCSDGPCQRNAKFAKCENCPYTLALVEANTAPVTVHNFDSFYYQTAFAKRFGGRSLLVIDECHNIESKYGGFMTFKLSSNDGYAIPEYHRLMDYDEPVREMYKGLSREFVTLSALSDVDGLTRSEFRRFQHLRSLLTTMDRYIRNREMDHPTEYIFEYKDLGEEQTVTFRPVLIGDFANQVLFRYGERVLMMSATILSKRIFCENVGLDPDDVYFLRVPSYFPAENRPIFRKNVGKMSFKDIDKTLPNVITAITEILEKFPKQKGIIQTHSERIANYIRSHMDDSRLTYNKDYSSPEEMLEVHRDKPSSFIVASGLREGLDLKGDLSKIQIFCKVPYPSMGDKWVKRRMDLDTEWYGYMTSLMFVQSLGRSIRSANDKAVTYILDSGFGWFYKSNKQFMPQYVRDAIK